MTRWSNTGTWPRNRPSYETWESPDGTMFARLWRFGERRPRVEVYRSGPIAEHVMTLPLNSAMRRDSGLELARAEAAGYFAPIPPDCPYRYGASGATV